MGGQEHFYLETHNCVVIPHEDDELEVISSTQHVDGAQVCRSSPIEFRKDLFQTEISRVLDIPQHKVRVSVKRVGGGFGGKESVAPLIAVPTALAASRLVEDGEDVRNKSSIRLRRPVKLVLERADDMALTGNRHPFRFDYKVRRNPPSKQKYLEMLFRSQ